MSVLRGWWMRFVRWLRGDGETRQVRRANQRARLRRMHRSGIAR